MDDVDPLIALARRVVQEAGMLGIETAVIGAMALAYHGYPRATLDVDLGACTDLSSKLRPLAENLKNLGLDVALSEPDDTDPLDGVLVVRARPGDEKVEIVNIRATAIGRAAVDRAHDGHDGFRYVRLPELIALKLHAGGPKSQRDIQAVLEANPEADLEEIRRVCSALGLEHEYRTVLSGT